MQHLQNVHPGCLSPNLCMHDRELRVRISCVYVYGDGDRDRQTDRQTDLALPPRVNQPWGLLHVQLSPQFLLMSLLQSSLALPSLCLSVCLSHSVSSIIKMLCFFSSFDTVLLLICMYICSSSLSKGFKH